MSDVFSGGESAAVESSTGSEKPLTDEERALLQRLLSDPFSIPQQFKTWLVAYLEGSDMLLARSSIQGLNDLLGSGGGGSGILGLLPAGIIFPYGGVDEPTGAKLCNGQSLPVASFKRLFDSIGYMYGGSGSNFNVPDLRRRVLFGAGSGIGHGASDGIAAETSRHIDHHHSFGQTSGGGGAHGHGWSGSVGGVGDHAHAARGPNFASRAGTPTAAGGSLRFTAETQEFDTAGAGGHSHSVSGWVDGVGDHTHFVSGDTQGGYENHHPAFLTVGFIINY